MSGLMSQTYWIWLIAGVLLCAVEIFAPGMFFLWIGLAALATGFLMAFVDIGFAWSLMIFGALSLIAVYAGYKLSALRGAQSDQPFLNRRADALVGRNFVLAEPISRGEGWLNVSDTRWRIRGPDMPAGVQVRVVAVEDTTTLRVVQA